VPQLPRLLSAAGLRTGFFYSDDTRYARTAKYILNAGVGTLHDSRTRNCRDTVVSTVGTTLATGDRCTFADLTQWIDERPDSPFFAVVWTFQTHYPYTSRRGRRFAIDPHSIPVERARGDLQRYLNAVSDADQLIDELIRHLEQENRARDTLIVITGDHGQAFGQHNGYGNGSSVYEENVHVPLMLINPGIAGGSFNRLTGHIDIAPTILDSLGLPLPSQWGESLFKPSRRAAVYFANMSTGPMIGYRSGDTKAFVDFVTGDVHAYDLSKDRAEKNDLQSRMPPADLKKQRSWLASWAVNINQGWLGKEGQ
jgi:phosphoglycerol transferase MdoB-like AlkP superfamily enzyme